MARKRWATFSVADHLDIRELVPDVLLFDRLAFPFPADEKEWDYWVQKKWDPKLLQYVLVELEDLAIPVDWGKEQREKFRTNMQQAEAVEDLPLSWIKYAGPIDEARKWENAKSMTRDIVGNHVREKRGTDFLVMPCYRSRDAFLGDQGAKISPADRNSRRERLALLVGQRMTVPDHADPRQALKLAIDLARDETYRRYRRRLFDWQEDVIRREQSQDDDLEQLGDLIAELNAYVARERARRRQQWVFYALKRVAGLVGDPIGLVADATIDAAEIISDKADTAPGAMAAFHHVRERVMDASIPRNPPWKVW